MHNEWEKDTEYLWGTGLSLGCYVLAIFGLGWSASSLSPHALWIASLVPSAAIACQLWFTFRLLGRLDEYIRAILMKRFIIAGGAAMIVATTWGFLETYSRVQHMPGWLIYPVFWAAFGIATPFVRNTGL